jgi:hypothetical protein
MESMSQTGFFPLSPSQMGLQISCRCARVANRSVALGWVDGCHHWRRNGRTSGAHCGNLRIHSQRLRRGSTPFSPTSCRCNSSEGASITRLYRLRLKPKKAHNSWITMKESAPIPP